MRMLLSEQREASFPSVVNEDKKKMVQQPCLPLSFKSLFSISSENKNPGVRASIKHLNCSNEEQIST